VCGNYNHYDCGKYDDDNDDGDDMNDNGSGDNSDDGDENGDDDNNVHDNDNNIVNDGNYDNNDNFFLNIFYISSTYLVAILEIDAHTHYTPNIYYFTHIFAYC